MKERLLETILHGISQIHVPLRDLGMGLARSAEKLFHLVREMPCQAHRSVRQHLHPLSTPQRLEVTHVQLEAAILQRDYFSNLVDVSVFAVRREPHHLAFIAILSIADEIADHGVETAQRVRQEYA